MTFKFYHFVIIQTIFLIIVLSRMLLENIYPSPPLFYDNNDTFMDFFNTCYWTLQKDDTYTSWQSIYPPFAHLICKISYFFIGKDNNNFLASGSTADWRENIYLVIPFLIMVFTYLTSIVMLIVERCKAIYSFWEIVLFSLSIIFSVSNLFLIERGNILMISVMFINIFFILQARKESSQVTYLGAILMSAAAAIKPYLIVTILLYRKINYFVTFILTFIILNVAALLIWQPKSPESILINLSGFTGNQDTLLLVSKCFYNFSLSSYKVITDLAKIFLSTQQNYLAIPGLMLLYYLGILMLASNVFRAFKLYLQFNKLLSQDFLDFLVYTFGMLLCNSLLTEANGYALTFLIPSLILFVSYFPKAKFNLYEVIVVTYILFYIPFLSENLYQVDFTESFLSEILHTPLRTLIPTATLDPLFRPLVFQLFFNVFITKVFSEVEEGIRISQY